MGFRFPVLPAAALEQAYGQQTKAQSSRSKDCHKTNHVQQVELIPAEVETSGSHVGCALVSYHVLDPVDGAAARRHRTIPEDAGDALHIFRVAGIVDELQQRVAEQLLRNGLKVQANAVAAQHGLVHVEMLPMARALIKEVVYLISVRHSPGRSRRACPAWARRSVRPPGCQRVRRG